MQPLINFPLIYIYGFLWCHKPWDNHIFLLIYGTLILMNTQNMIRMFKVIHWKISPHNTDFVITGCISTHWGRVTHTCVGNLTIIGSDNGLSPGQRQAIIWTNTGILLIGTLGINFSEISIEILTFSFKEMRLNCRLRNGGHFVGLNVLKTIYSDTNIGKVDIMTTLGFQCNYRKNCPFNTLRLRQNGCYFQHDIFNLIFLNENVWKSLQISDWFR